MRTFQNLLKRNTRISGKGNELNFLKTSRSSFFFFFVNGNVKGSVGDVNGRQRVNLNLYYQ